MDYFKCMPLQSLKLCFCRDQLRFSQHLWRSQDARWFPIDGALHGNEFVLRGSMGQRSGQIVVLPAS